MITVFGWKAVIVFVVNALAATLLFRKKKLGNLIPIESIERNSLLGFFVLVHMAFLAVVVVFAQYPAIFMGSILFFLGVAHVYQHKTP